jgi:hypothetical protein
VHAPHMRTGGLSVHVFTPHTSAFDAVDGARSVASKCHRVVA